MRVPARFDGPSLALWILAAIVALGLAWCDPRTHREPRRSAPADAGIEWIELSPLDGVDGADAADDP